MSNLVLLGVSNYPFSFALWVQPVSTSGGTLVRLFSVTNGTQRWCVDMLGLSASGRVVAATWNGAVRQVLGPNITANVWTHVASTYSVANGLRLYVNGTLIGSISSSTYNAPSRFNFLTLGNAFAGSPCNTTSISSGSYSGYLDEFRVYSRELTAAAISILAR